jgi:hypothetical protein
MSNQEILEYKAYYHILVPFPDGLVCLGSNLPDHPKGSCLVNGHPLVSKSNPSGSI